MSRSPFSPNASRLSVALLAVTVAAFGTWSAAPVRAADGKGAQQVAAGESSVRGDATPGSDPNGFSLDAVRVPRESILAGGPPRDGIRAIDEPRFVAPSAATWVEAETHVLGLAHGDETRAYPIHLLEYHQVVNDEFDGEPVAVTYDPLTGCPIAYRARVGERILHFGVSGLIYESGFLLYDRETESLWSQMLGEAVSGPLAGTKLERLPVRQEPMGVWLYRHPESRILAPPFPKRIDYRVSRFTNYWTSDRVLFPVSHRDTRFHPKEVALGLVVDGVERAYLGSVLTAHQGRIVDELGGRKVRIAYDGETGTFSWNVPPAVEVTDAYWFAWKNFHPRTEIWGEASLEKRPRTAPADDD